MTRALRIILHNWPLKLAAIGLATILYSGIVLSEGADDFPGQIPITWRNLPDGMHVTEGPPNVTNVRYFAAAGADPVSTDTFRASIDAGGIGERGGTFDLPVQVTSIDPQIQVIGVTPSRVRITVEPVVDKMVKVIVERGEIPDGLQIGEERIEPATVMVRGPRSIVDEVVGALATVAIQPSALDVDQDVTLVPVDAIGNARSSVDVSPAQARIRIQVFSEPSSRTLRINPVITGTPAAGFELDTVTVEPQTALVEGDADPLAGLSSLDTEPLSISGASETLTFDAVLSLPDGIEHIEQDPITVTVTFRSVTESRTFTVGVVANGQQAGLDYDLGVDRVQLVIGGNPAALDALTAADGPVATVDVTGLAAGTYDLAVSAALPSGLTLVTANPATVSVTIAAPAAEVPSPTGAAASTGS